MGLRVLKHKSVGAHNQQASGCCLGASSLLDVVAVLVVDVVTSRLVLTSRRTCKIGPTVAEKEGENKKKAEREYQGTYSVRLELGCARRALWWSLAAAKN